MTGTVPAATADRLSEGHGPAAYVSFGIAGALGAFAFNSVPFVVGAATEAFRSASVAGMLASVEFTFLAITPLLAARLGGRNARTLLLAAAVLLVAGQAATLLGLRYAALPLVVAARAVAGGAEGMLYALSNAFASRTTTPTRTFSLFAMMQATISMGMFAVLIYGFRLGNAALPGGFAAITAVALVPLLFTPADAMSGLSRSRTTVLPSLDSRLALGAFAAFLTATYLMVPYAERIGRANGFSSLQIATVISFHSLPAFVGPPIAALLTRLGRVWPSILLILAEAVTMWGIVLATDITMWAAAILAFTLSMYVLMPILYGAFARLDPTGATNVYTVTVAAAAAAVGPAIAALVVAGSEAYVRIGYASVIVYAAMLLLLMRPLLRAAAAGVPASERI